MIEDNSENKEKYRVAISRNLITTLSVKVYWIVTFGAVKRNFAH